MPESAETIRKREANRRGDARRAGTDAGKTKSGHAGYSGPVKLCFGGGNLVNAILSISRKGLSVPGRELCRERVPAAEYCVLDDLCGIRRECFCRAPAWKPPYYQEGNTHTDAQTRYTPAPLK